MSSLTFTRVGKNFFRSDDGTDNGAGPYSVWVKKEAKTLRGIFQRLWQATYTPLVGDTEDLGDRWASAGDAMAACRRHAELPGI